MAFCFLPKGLNISYLFETNAFLQKIIFRSKMERLEEDLRFFRRELERENDPFRRQLLQQRIAVTERAILALMIEERERIQRQNSNMERALELLRKREEDKKK